MIYFPYTIINIKNYNLFRTLFRVSDRPLIIVMMLCEILSSLYYFFVIIINNQYIIYFNIKFNNDDLSISITAPSIALFIMFFRIQIITIFLELLIHII